MLKSMMMMMMGEGRNDDEFMMCYDYDVKWMSGEIGANGFICDLLLGQIPGKADAARW